MTQTNLQELRKKLNQHLSNLDNHQPHLFTSGDEPTDPHDRPKTIVRGIQICNNSAYLLDFDTPDSAERFLSYSRDHIFLLAAHFGTTAAIKTKRYPLIMKFVLCTGNFDPKKAKCIVEIEDTCSLSRGSIISAKWIKRPDRCAPSAAFQGQKLVSSLQINLCKHPSFNIVTFCVTYCHKKAKLFISLLIPLLTWVGASSTLLKIKIFFDCVL